MGKVEAGSSVLAITRAAYTAGGGALTPERRCAHSRDAAGLRQGGPGRPDDISRAQATRLAAGLELAGSLGYESGRLNDNGSRARAFSDMGLGLVALRYRAGPWTLDGVLDFAGGGLTTRCTIAVAGSATASATTNTFTSGLHLRAGYTVPLGAAYVEPALELDTAYVHIGGYTEHGSSPFNLKVKALDDVGLAATPGVRVGTYIGLARRQRPTSMPGQASASCTATPTRWTRASPPCPARQAGSAARSRTTASAAASSPAWTCRLSPGSTSSCSIRGVSRATRRSMAVKRALSTASVSLPVRADPLDMKRVVSPVAAKLCVLAN